MPKRFQTDGSLLGGGKRPEGSEAVGYTRDKGNAVFVSRLESPVRTY